MDRQPVLVMGICGTGKSTLAAAIAARLQGSFIEGDDYHSPENIAHMAAGQPLTDDMRLGWLDRLGEAMREAPAPAVLSCSALRHSYRQRLARMAGPMRIIFLHGPRPLIEARMAARAGHFMPATLVDSQLDTLEPPDPINEGAIWIDICNSPDIMLHHAMTALAGKALS
ncbi:gluconokinase [Paracoccus seriniphilus]|uniref:Gluconokinase n=1 Tax=Paracoccus seriniphilus TaxID=184748 RepID=A0A239PN71_9RHOB|nr:gluconokinase [Paracoccus seriniphilus]WCR13792.1 gluconokinase [Paracoccus seriniphilus]SNT68594.1 gluconate kinase, SKI family [Paracoccus seriniphilus]